MTPRSRFRKVLIANRGEIAVRISRTLRQMGIIVVAVFAETDRGAAHVLAADEAWPLEGATVGQTYLDAEQIVAIATRCGAEAIHPGYGFLSENADFAERVAQAGLVFVGPRADVIRQMGDKIVSKRIMAEAGVPVVPGILAPADEEADLARMAAEIGYPVLVKAAAGGGGKGMRVVEGDEELRSAVAAASREAASSFGDPTVFLEKYVTRPRHVEVQVLADEHGGRVHLWERECSIQRRHQKIVEESPSVALTPELRAQMGAAALRAVEAVGYTSAGTVEFIVAPDGHFYFLEMNTRLQVEHAVTEAIMGWDLVRLQMQVAAGEELPFGQDDVRPRGHALECRVYAEEPERGFLPSTGTVLRYRPPEGPWIRVDSGIREGSVVTVHHDPMLAKVITWGEDRDMAIARMKDALGQFVLLGVTSNIAYLRRVVTHADFRAGHVHTHFLEERPELAEGAVGSDEVGPAAWMAAVVARERLARRGGFSESGRPTGASSPWETAGAWRGLP